MKSSTSSARWSLEYVTPVVPGLRGSKTQMATSLGVRQQFRHRLIGAWFPQRIAHRKLLPSRHGSPYSAMSFSTSCSRTLEAIGNHDDTVGVDAVDPNHHNP